MSPDELLDIAREAAQAAAPLLLARFGSEPALATKSSPTDMVSAADVAAEQAIRAVLAARVPDDAVVGEEGADRAGTTGRRWLIDPIDGTTNYLYGNPHWCISVACDGLAAVVLDPVRDELFAASADRQASLNGTPIGPPGPASLDTLLLGTGFGYDGAVRARQAEIVARLLPLVRDIRRAGSAALDLAWAAAGRLDAYFEYGIKEWDICAGSLICRQAGLVVERLPPVEGLQGGIVAAPARYAEPLRALITGR